MPTSQPSSFSERQAAYAAWKDRLQSDKAEQKIIDLTEDLDVEPSMDWSTEALFEESRRIASEEDAARHDAG